MPAVPLYLEWAPEGVFATPAPTQPLQRAGRAKAGGPQGDAPPVGEVEGAGAGPLSEEVGTLYVKNISFNTTDAAFKKLFDKVGATCGGQVGATWGGQVGATGGGGWWGPGGGRQAGREGCWVWDVETALNSKPCTNPETPLQAPCLPPLSALNPQP